MPRCSSSAFALVAALSVTETFTSVACTIGASWPDTPAGTAVNDVSSVSSVYRNARPPSMAGHAEVRARRLRVTGAALALRRHPNQLNDRMPLGDAPLHILRVLAGVEPRRDLVDHLLQLCAGVQIHRLPRLSRLLQRHPNVLMEVGKLLHVRRFEVIAPEHRHFVLADLGVVVA